ncbi:MAG TPA: hypothetical protein VEZ11_09575 [Thermoanaerobaculia bacterium]|nr:hypothetical protein [Thermoanaerobaculia bacterium]
MATQHVAGPPDVLRCTAALGQHALELGEIARRQWLIRAQLAQGDVILVRLQKLPRLRPEALEVACRRERLQCHLDLGAHLIFEVRVDDSPVLPLDQRDQRSQPFPDVLEHRQRRGLPPRGPAD